MDWDATIGEAAAVRRVFDGVPTMVIAYQGAGHRCVAVNAAARAVFPAIRVGTAVGDLFLDVYGHNLRELLDRVYCTGETVHAQQWRLHLDAGPSGAPRELFLDLVINARRADDGGIEGVQVMGADVTARVREQRQAQAHAEEISHSIGYGREVSVAMQQALLAPSLPVLPGAEIAAEYLVATEYTGAGGDWFDAIPRGDGEVFLVVGDVVGHGVEAAAVMSQLRAVTRQQLLAGNNITETVRALYDFSAHVPGSQTATMCLGRLDTATGVFEYCTAGHPPPLLLAGGEPRYVEPSGAGPLGSGTEIPTLTVTLGVGDVVLLYSDGVIERPGRPLAASTTEFADLAARILHRSVFPLDTTARPVDRVCAQTLELLVRTTGYSDDITLLAAQRRVPPPPLTVTVDADKAAAHTTRAALRDWLSVVGADTTDTTIVVHAVSEFVDNAVEHAYSSPAAGGITVEASLDEHGHLHASVSDRGQWKAPVRVGRRGRGLSLVNTLLTRTLITGSDTGTTASASHPLTRPARIVTDPTAVDTLKTRSMTTELVTNVSNDGHLMVSGDIDNTSAALLAAAIVNESHSGTTSLTVDLSSVTLLGSAGLRILAKARDDFQRYGTELCILAPPGSPAHHVLMLTQLPIANVAATDPTDTA